MSESSREQENITQEHALHLGGRVVSDQAAASPEAAELSSRSEDDLTLMPSRADLVTPCNRANSEVFFVRTRVDFPVTETAEQSSEVHSSSACDPELPHVDLQSNAPQGNESSKGYGPAEQFPLSGHRSSRIDAPQRIPEPNRHFGNAAHPAKAATTRGTASPSTISQAVLTMAMLGMTLAAARFFVPSIIEEARYAWRRGQLRADYESSQSGLRDVGMENLSSAYKMVTQRVAPSVVHIDVLRRVNPIENSLGFRGMEGSQPTTIPGDQGSGVIVDPEGYILTNHHVIADGDEIAVGLSDGRRVRATVVGSDPLTDLALLRVNESGLLAVEWGDSEATEVGIPVWAVGSPFGLDHTITFGILSGKHRAAKAGTSYQDFMQSDVAVNPGNSGGPLVDSLGRLIGINTAIVGDTYRGVSFSVPSNVAKRVYERLRESGRFERGWLGVELAEVPDDDIPGLSRAGQRGSTRGAMIRRLADPRSPAANAGLTTGDIIVRFDGQEVSDVSSLMRMVGNWPAGQSAVLDVVRDGQEQAFAVQIGARPETLNGR